MAVEIPADLKERVAALPEISQALILSLLGQEENLLKKEADWRETAHECKQKHEFAYAPPGEPVQPGDSAALKASKEREERIRKNSPTSYPACHDCGRPLVGDRGEEAVLICPKLHACRPSELTGVVECGQPGV